MWGGAHHTWLLTIDLEFYTGEKYSLITKGDLVALIKVGKLNLFIKENHYSGDSSQIKEVQEHFERKYSG